MIAFANSKGGKIIVGIGDNGEVKGVVASQKLEERVANYVSDLSTPRIGYTLSYETIADHTVMVIDVLPGSFTPYYLTTKGIQEGTFVRIGSTSRRADRAELAELLRRGQGIPFDLEEIGPVVDLDESLFFNFVKKRSDRFGAPSLVVSLENLKDQGIAKHKRLTVAGALLFTANPQKYPELCFAFIRAGRFKGLEKGILIDQAEFAGPLTRQIEDAVHFALKNSRVSAIIEGTKRIDTFEYPEKILREMITNAVVHRDYSITGASIMLAMFDDRIEISSPGGLPSSITPENIADRQFSRNPIIAKRMFEMGYFDSWGQGIDMILEWARRNGGRIEFIDSRGEYKLIAHSPFVPPSLQLSVDFDSTQIKKILRYTEKNGRISNRECRNILDISKTKAQVLLKKMVEKGLLQQQGRGRSSEYIMV
jgi:ATP-dependent DNA helicase RecG